MVRQVLEQQKEQELNQRNKMAKTNTEKPTTKQEAKKQGVVSTPKQKENKIIEEKIKNETGKKEDTQKPKEESKKPIVKKPIKKKTEAIVRGRSLPISTKHSIAICRFIKGKKIGECISYLEQVVVGKKAIPMKGEIPHRKGKMMSGRFPKKASEQFIKLLRSLGANANANNLEEPIISEAVANFASRPYGRFGRTQKKRTHIIIKCRERKGK